MLLAEDGNIARVAKHLEVCEQTFHRPPASYRLVNEESMPQYRTHKCWLNSSSVKYQD
jgi:hypothetical protein